MTSHEAAELPPTIDNSFLTEVRDILEAHKDERVVVVGTTCTGKSTLLKSIDGALDMDEVLFPQLSEDEVAYVCQKPWTDDGAARKRTN